MADEEIERSVLVERLSNVEKWEIYQLIDDDEEQEADAEPGADPTSACKVALRPDYQAGQVEYGLWRGDDADVADTGSVEWSPSDDGWTDVARVDALRQIVYRYEEDLGVEQGALEFLFVEEDEEYEDDEGEDDEDD